MSKVIKFKLKLDKGATIPKRAHEQDVGYDVTLTRFELVGLQEVITIGRNYEFNYDEVMRFIDYYTTAADHIVCERIPKYVVCHTGVHVQPMDPDYYVEAHPNSRTGKRPVWLGNCIGTIDGLYTGEVLLIYKIASHATMEQISEYFTPGKVVGQFKIKEKIDADFILVDELNATERGDGGFGSTEKSSAAEEEKALSEISVGFKKQVLKNKDKRMDDGPVQHFGLYPKNE